MKEMTNTTEKIDLRGIVNKVRVEKEIATTKAIIEYVEQVALPHLIEKAQNMAGSALLTLPNELADRSATVAQEIELRVICTARGGAQYGTVCVRW